MENTIKKYYIRPAINTIKLDKVVSLTPPSSPSSVAPIDKDRPTFGPSSVPPSSASNPFGGSTPDYGDM